jgi:hypothetical protein
MELEGPVAQASLVKRNPDTRWPKITDVQSQRVVVYHAMIGRVDVLQFLWSS